MSVHPNHYTLKPYALRPKRPHTGGGEANDVGVSVLREFGVQG